VGPGSTPGGDPGGQAAEDAQVQEPHTPGSWLKQRRLDLGLTQQQVAEVLGVSGPSVSLYESDNRTPGAATCAALRKVLLMDEGDFWHFMTLVEEASEFP